MELIIRLVLDDGTTYAKKATFDEAEYDPERVKLVGESHWGGMLGDVRLIAKRKAEASQCEC